jgi:hypothetical protein
MHITPPHSLTPNALEGCYYLFPDAAATWEAGYSLLATGTEDYFESAFYFDAGVYAQPYTGVTVREGAEGAPSRISAYKIHGSHDPMVFSDGFALKWRNGGSVMFLLSPRIERLAVFFLAAILPISYTSSRPLVLCFRIRTPAVCMVFPSPAPLRHRSDLQDSQGFKCRCPTSATPGCTKVGDPQQTNVTSYAWVYTW